jgi:hypothetical protein
MTSDLVITWKAPHMSKNSILGFKINWDLPSIILPVARDSVPLTTITEKYSYTISRNSFLGYNQLAVYVWAYSIHGDGPIAEAQFPSPSEQNFVGAWVMV